MLSAAITVISVTIGIVALRQIQSNMNVTTKNIGINIDSQNAIISQLMPLRSLVAHINTAKSSAELAEKDKEIKLLRDSWKERNRQEQIIVVDDLEKLYQHKQRHFQALRDLFELRKSNAVTLIEATRIANTILNDPKFSSAAQIDEAISGIKTHFSRMLSVTETAIRTVRAALFIKACCNELNLIFKDALLLSDSAEIAYIASELSTMFANIHVEAKNLPADDNTLKLTETLAELEKIVIEAFHAGANNYSLSELLKKSDSMFQEAGKLSMQIVDNAEFDSSMRIEEAASQIQRDLDQTSAISLSAVSVIKAAMSLRYYCNELNAKVKDALMATDIKSVDQTKAEISSLLSGTRKELLELPKDEKTLKIAEIVDTLAPLTEKMFDAVRQVLSANDALNETSEKIRQDMAAVDEMVINAAKNMKSDANRKLEDTQSLVYRWQYFQILIGFIAVILALAVGYLTSKSMNKTIRGITVGMSDSVSQVASVSTQVSGVNEQLVEGASRQKISIDKTSASVKELLDLTRKNEETANSVNDMMKKTSQVLEDSAYSMSELTHSIQEISSASRETRKIVYTIDEIAFQTRLLSLNASIEAARAGDSGMGFAVVAEEVRNLSIRSAEAAKTTASLVENIIRKIQEQHQFVEKTDGHFSQLSKSVRDVDDLVKDMIMAFNEQADGIEQINEAVREVEEVISQNAANAEKSVVVFGELNYHTERMLSYIRILRGLEEQHLFQRYIRIPESVSGTFYFASKYERFVTKNMSAGGLLIHTEHPLNTGESGKIELDIEGISLPLLKTKVIRQAGVLENGQYMFAMKFISVDSKTRKILDNMIYAFLHPSEIPES